MCDCCHKIESVDKITFTKRHFDVFSRWLKVQSEGSLKELDDRKCIECMGEDDNEPHPYRSMTFKNIQIVLNPEYQNNDDEDDPHIEIYIEFNLRFSDRCNDNKKVKKIGFGYVVDNYYNHPTDYDDAMKELEKLIGTEYIKCKDLYCTYSKSSFSDYCEDCYTYFIEIEDKCPICLINQGRFIIPDCGHIIHFNCYNHMHGNKCPLCREPMKNLMQY